MKNTQLRDTQMRDKVGERLEALRSEFASGQKMLAELSTRQSELQQTVLRISGAIQALEELLGETVDSGAEATDPPVPFDVG